MVVLVWDFDGVMVDSLTERAIVAHLTYKAYKKGKTDVWDISPEEINPENPNIRKTIELIRKKRPYIAPDEGGSRNFLEQLILLNDYNLDFNSLEEFIRLRKERSDLDGVGEKCRRLFFSLDDHLFETFRDKWVALTSFYEEVKEKFMEMRELFDCYICSSSERRRISRILEYNGIDFDPRYIFSMDFGGTQEITQGKRTSKLEKVRKIMSHKNSNEREIHYIDDEVSQTLIMSSEFPKMHVYLATWGYVPNGWEELIRNTGITPVYLSDFSKTIQSASK